MLFVESLVKAIANEVLTKRGQTILSKVIDLPTGQSRLHSTLLETMCFQKNEKYILEINMKDKHLRAIPP